MAQLYARCSQITTVPKSLGHPAALTLDPGVDCVCGASLRLLHVVRSGCVVLGGGSKGTALVQ